MSKIKAYLDTDILFEIINNNFDNKKINCISSMQAVTEVFVKYNLSKEHNAIFCLLVQNAKIRCIDYEVLEKFNQIYDGDIKNAGLFLQYAVAILENCEYFITNDKILEIVGIKTILPKELDNNKSSQTPTLFDL